MSWLINLKQRAKQGEGVVSAGDSSNLWGRCGSTKQKSPEVFQLAKFYLKCCAEFVPQRWRRRAEIDPREPLAEVLSASVCLGHRMPRQFWQVRARGWWRVSVLTQRALLLLVGAATEGGWVGMWPHVCLSLHSRPHASRGSAGTAYVCSIVPRVSALYRGKQPSKQKTSKTSHSSHSPRGHTLLLRAPGRWFAVGKDLFLHKMGKRQSPDPWKPWVEFICLRQ